MNLTPMARYLLTSLVGGAVVLLAAYQPGTDTAGPRPDATGTPATATPTLAPRWHHPPLAAPTEQTATPQRHAHCRLIRRRRRTR